MFKLSGCGCCNNPNTSMDFIRDPNPKLDYMIKYIATTLAAGHSSIKYYYSHLIGESSNKITKNKKRRCKMHHKNTHTIYKFKNIKI